MKTLVLYDSAYGNTSRAATAIGRALPGDVEVTTVQHVDPRALQEADLVFVGSPTQNRKPTKAMTRFLDDLSGSALEGKRVAAFDTRYAGKLVGFFSAAKKMADQVVSKGGALAAPPEGFIVSGKEGPLKAGELERAARWAAETAAGTITPAGN